MNHREAAHALVNFVLQWLVDLNRYSLFTIKRSDYKVKATSALHGTSRVRDRLKFTFDIVAHQI